MSAEVTKACQHGGSGKPARRAPIHKSFSRANPHSMHSLKKIEQAIELEFDLGVRGVGAGANE
jgi:hypothetical protein